MELFRCRYSCVETKPVDSWLRLAMFAATESSLSAIRFPEKNNESSVKFCHYIIAYQMDQEWTSWSS